MKRFFIYARKSSEAEDRQILSIGSQINELMSLAKKLGIEIVDTLQEAKSAKAPGRQVFDEMMRRINAGEVDGILCWKLDRLARNPIDGGAIIWTIKQNGIEILTPSQTYNQISENAFMMYVEFGMAQKFVDDLSKNVKRGLKEKAEKGWLPSGAKPGYMNDKFAEKGNKTVKTDPLRFPLIRRAWDYMLSGTYTVAQILTLLNNEWSYRTPKHKRIGGKPMSRSMLYHVFTDTFYYGEFEYPSKSGILHQGKHKPMITIEEFDKVQFLLGRNGRPRPKTHKFNYVGLMVCGECEAAITCEEKIKRQKNGNVHKYIYYHCTKRKNPNCTQGSIEEKELEKQIDEELSKIQISDKFKNWAIKYLNELNNKEAGDRNAILSSTQEAYKDIVKRIDNLVGLKISTQNSDNSLLSDEEFKIQKQILLKEKSTLEEKLNDTGDRITKWLEFSEKTFDFATYAKYRFAKGTPEEKRKIFAGLGSNLILKDRIIAVKLEKPLEYMQELKIEEDKNWLMLEPAKKADNTIQIEDLWAQNSALLRD